MASYHFSGSPTRTDARPVDLSAEERGFLDFLLYQYGGVYLDEAAGTSWEDWEQDLKDKLRG